MFTHAFNKDQFTLYMCTCIVYNMHNQKKTFVSGSILPLPTGIWEYWNTRVLELELELELELVLEYKGLIPILK